MNTSTESMSVRHQSAGLRWAMSIRQVEGGPLIEAAVSFYDARGDAEVRKATFLAVASKGRQGGPPGVAVLLPSTAEYVLSGDCISITGAELIVLNSAVVQEIRQALSNGQLSPLPA